MRRPDHGKRVLSLFAMLAVAPAYGAEEGKANPSPRKAASDLAQDRSAPPRQDKVSPALMPVLKRAQDALKSKQWAAALAELNTAESTPGKTEFDQSIIVLMRQSAQLNLSREAAR